MEAKESSRRTEAILVVVYCIAYLGYLFIKLETELWHWVSLVSLPLLLIYLYYRKKFPAQSLRASLASVGLTKGNLTNGLIWAAILGLGLSALQLPLSRNSGKIWELLQSGKIFILFPITLGLMFVTAGFTEEFFFRGALQTRLEAALKSKVWAIVIAAVLFGFYHLPYAYLHPNWPSHGNWGQALSASLGQGIPAGLILGALYVRAKNNLLACVIAHSLINVLPAMTMIRFGKS